MKGFLHLSFAMMLMGSPAMAYANSPMAMVPYAPEQIQGSGSQDDPYILAWDTESFVAPAGRNIYKLECNYEGVLTIAANYSSDYVAKLSINGKPVGNVVNREVKVNRQDVIVFDITAREDNNTISLSYRSVEEGEAWNMPIILNNGENDIPAIKENVNLPKWYKVAVPAGAQLDIEMGTGIATVFTAETAAEQKDGVDFTNKDSDTMFYHWANDTEGTVDVYVKVAHTNGETKADVKLSYTLFDELTIAGPAAAKNPNDYSYVEILNRFEGVVEITNNTSADQIALIVNDTQVVSAIAKNGETTSILAKQGDVLKLKMLSQQTQTDKTIILKGRAVAEGDVWNMPIALKSGENGVPAIKQNINLPKWYKVSVPAGAQLDVQMDYCTATAFTADNAAAETDGIAFQNNDKGSALHYANDSESTVDLYIKVAQTNAAGVADVKISYVLFDELSIAGPAAAQNPNDYSYVDVLSRVEGVVEITNNTSADQIALIVNGTQVASSIAKNGETTSVLVKQGDVLTFKMVSRETQTDKTIILKGRAVAEGDVWNMPIALKSGENDVPAIKQNINLPKWYKVSVPAGAQLDVQMDYCTATAFTADNAAAETDGIAFQNNDKGSALHYANDSESIVDLYIKVAQTNAAGVADVKISYVLFDELSITGPAAAQNPNDYSYVDVLSRVEGVVEITNNTSADQIALIVNGTQVVSAIAKNGETTSVLVKQGDVLTFKMVSQQTQTDKTIILKGRAVAEGDVWNMPIALKSGENDVPAIKQNINLPKWYKVSVPAGAQLDVQMDYCTATAFTADNAAAETEGIAFQNNDKGSALHYANDSESIVDLYIKVAQTNAEGVADVKISYVLFDELSIAGPAAAQNPNDYSYVDVLSRVEGVVEITNNTSADQIALIVNGNQVVSAIAKNGETTSVLVKQGDVLTFKMVSQQTQTDKTIDLKWRAVAEGDVWNMPIALQSGENDVPAIKQNINLPKWYKVSVPAGAQLDVQMDYCTATAFTADNAAAETDGIAFQNNDKGSALHYANDSESIVDLYIKVAQTNAAGVADVKISYVLFDELSIAGPAAAQNPNDYSYVDVLSRVEGVVEITNNTSADQIALIVNGNQVVSAIAKNGETTSVLVKQGDVLTFKMVSRETQTDKTIDLKWRAVADGDVWNMPIALKSGENDIPEIKNNINLPQWYKVAVPAGAQLDIEMGTGIATAFTAETAAEQKDGVDFTNKDSDTMFYHWANDTEGTVDVYVKVAHTNGETKAVVNISYILFDDLSIAGPAKSAGPTDFTVVDVLSRVEGVVEITNNTQAYQIALLKNGEPAINSIASGDNNITSIIVKQGDVLTFKMVSQDNQTGNTIDLHWRAFAEGDIWNMPIALAEGENELPAIKQNINLAKWYKVSVPARGLYKVVMSDEYATVAAYTADNAAAEENPIEFNNGVLKLEGNGKAYDIYIKVSCENMDEQSINLVSNIVNLAWDTEAFNGPAADMDKTYYVLDCNYEGVMTINSNLEGNTLTTLYVNNKPMGLVCDREILVNRHDQIIFAIACQDDNTDKTVELSYRPVAEGETWNSALVAAPGDNDVPAIKNNVDLAQWYKVTVPAGTVSTLSMGYGKAELFTADNAAAEEEAINFVNGENGMTCSYTNETEAPVDVYVKVSISNEPTVLNVSGEGTEEVPYVLYWDAKSFRGPQAGEAKTYYELVSNYEGVLSIKSNLTDVTASDLCVNGVRIGDLASREILISRKDVVTFAMACSDGNEGRKVELSYRPVREGEIWNMAKELVSGDNNIVGVTEGVNVAAWYKVTVPAKQIADINFSNEIEAVGFVAGDAMSQANPLPFSQGHIFGYANENAYDVDIYIMILGNNAANTVANVVFSGQYDGIESISADVDSNAKAYDLSGRQVKTMVKGNVYITNGKKVVK